MLQNGDVAKSQRRSNEKESLKLIEMKEKKNLHLIYFEYYEKEVIRQQELVRNNLR